LYRYTVFDCGELPPVARRCKLTDPQLESAWFQPLNLGNVICWFQSVAIRTRIISPLTGGVAKMQKRKAARWGCVQVESSVTNSSKAPGGDPTLETYKSVKTWFQAFAFTWVNLYCYGAGKKRKPSEKDSGKHKKKGKKSKRGGAV
jgi:hypothetical protein